MSFDATFQLNSAQFKARPVPLSHFPFAFAFNFPLLLLLFLFWVNCLQICLRFAARGLCSLFRRVLLTDYFSFNWPGRM